MTRNIQSPFHRLGRRMIHVALLTGSLPLAVGLAHGAPLPIPAMAGPLTSPSPFQFDAGPLGKLDITGVMSGMGVWQDNPVSGDRFPRAYISNGQIFIQKTHGLIQFSERPGIELKRRR